MDTEKHIYVYFDGEQVTAPMPMGVLNAIPSRGKEVFSFQFTDEWLQSKISRSFDPDLQLFRGRQFVPEGKSLPSLESAGSKLIV